MKKLTALIFAVLAVSCLFANDLVEGYWKSIDEKDNKITGVWKIYQKDGVLFGEPIFIPGLTKKDLASGCKESYKDFPIPGKVNEMPLVGTPFIFGLTKRASGQWQNGNIIDPKDGRMYKCKITFRAKDGKKYQEDTLEMRGEIGLGIGRSQYWVKATDEEVNAIFALD